MKIQENGMMWKDTAGNKLLAHGGHILFHEGVYYWYGENRTDRNYVSCYSSTDLVNWTHRNNVLTMDSPVQKNRVNADLRLQTPEGGRVTIERPKVRYNEATGKFVMWMHFENGKDYLRAEAAVATCDTPDGDFVYHGSFRPYGEYSRDCTMFRDGTKAYFISSARDNQDMHIYLLQEDWLNVKKQVANLWPNEYREAPSVVKIDDTYYMITSGCTGGEPNQQKYAATKDFEDGFDMMTPIGDETCFDSQAAFVLTIKGSKTTSYVYVGDRWLKKGMPHGFFGEYSGYVWFPLVFDENGKMVMIPCKELDINAETGEISWSEETVTPEH